MRGQCLWNLGNIDVPTTRGELGTLFSVREVCGQENDKENDTGNAVVTEDKHRANPLDEDAPED